MVRSLSDEKGRKAVKEAIAKDDPSIFKRAQPAQGNIMEAEKYRLQLISAASCGNYDLALEALDKGADPNTKDNEGTPVLILLAKLYAKWTMLTVADPFPPRIDRTAELLLSRGADPYATDASGKNVFAVKDGLIMDCIGKLKKPPPPTKTQ